MNTESKIIIHPEAFSQLFLPDKLLHRDKERSQLLNNLRNFVNTFICGSCGSGKTTLAKHALTEFNASRIGHAVYTDCAVYQTTL